MLGELQMDASTDVHGHYMIPNVPAGKYTLEVSYMGYPSGKRKCAVSSAATTVVDFALRSRGLNSEVLYLVGPVRASDRRYMHFQLGRASVGWPGFAAGNTDNTGWTTGWVGTQLEVGGCAWGRGLTSDLGYLLGFKLAEWYDEGGTRDGLPAILPVYLYLASAPPYLFPVSCQTNTFGYVMGSISGSVGAGAGIHWEWRDVMPGVELNWTHSWRGSDYHSSITLNLGVGIGFWYRSRPGYM